MRASAPETAGFVWVAGVGGGATICGGEDVGRFGVGPLVVCGATPSFTGRGTSRKSAHRKKAAERIRNMIAPDLKTAGFRNALFMKLGSFVKCPSSDRHLTQSTRGS